MSTPKISDKQRSEFIMMVYFPGGIDYPDYVPLMPPEIPPHILQVIEDFIKKN